MPETFECGHPDTEENTYRRKSGREQCHTCKKAKEAAWYAANKLKVSARKKTFLENNRDRESARKTGWYAANKEKVSTQAAALNVGLRSAALDAYGRECACCGESIERFLTIDHVNDDGAEHRKEIGKSLYRWLKTHSYPEGFRVLCSSCNAGRYINGGNCPHSAPVQEPSSHEQRYRRKLKAETFDVYGGKCACCEEAEITFLCIDHINNDGASHRREVGHTLASMCRWLRDRGYPDGYQVLCFNCNDGKHWNGGVCPHHT